MKLSENNKVLIYASNNGYAVDTNGDVFFRGKKRVLGINASGYYCFTVRFKIKSRSVFRKVLVHQLQAYQKFNKIIFFKKIQVRHLDGIKINNSISNISIGTRSQNQMDIPESIRKNRALIATVGARKYSHEDVIKLHKQGLTYVQIMKELNVSSKGTISWIINKSIYSHSS